MRYWVRAWGATSAIVCIAACGSSASSNEGSAGFGGGGSNAPTGGSSGGGSSGGASGDGGTDSGPPETKAEGDYQSPVSTGQYVWITNPVSGRVAYIQATTLQVATIAAGNQPTYLAAVPDPTADTAIVLNVLSHDATLLRASGGKLATKSFPIATDVNAWAVSPNGRWALAWGDVTRATNPDPTQGFQDVSALDLSGQDPPTIVSVGFRPVSVAFASDSRHAYAVTQDGVSVVDLTGPAPVVAKNFPVSTDPNDDPGTRDVSVTPDGSYALVRRDNQATISVVSLSDGTLTTVTLPANATDLTLSPSGGEAVVVMRDIATVAFLPLPGIASDPTTFNKVAITGQTVGRAIVADDSKTTLLFTTVLPVDTMTILDLPSLAFRTSRLHLPIHAVFPTHDAQNAIVLHSLPPDAGTSANGAFSVLPVGQELPAKLVGTSAPPNAVALSPASDRALVTARDDGTSTFEAYLVKLPSLEVDAMPLASPPIAAGVVQGANAAYVAQSDPEGRITFIDLTSGQARTLTGFELGSRVVDGSKP